MISVRCLRRPVQSGVDDRRGVGLVHKSGINLGSPHMHSMPSRKKSPRFSLILEEEEEKEKGEKEENNSDNEEEEEKEEEEKERRKPKLSAPIVLE